MAVRDAIDTLRRQICTNHPPAAPAEIQSFRVESVVSRPMRLLVEEFCAADNHFVRQGDDKMKIEFRTKREAKPWVMEKKVVNLFVQKSDYTVAQFSNGEGIDGEVIPLKLPPLTKGYISAPKGPGLGTRLLPATKSQPKEMLPLVDKPIIQYGVEEALASGINNIILVTSRGKSAIEDHFDVSAELESFLESRNKTALLGEVRRIAKLVTVSSVRQGEALGLGHALLVARGLVTGDEQDGAPPGAAERRVDPRLAHEHAVEPEVDVERAVAVALG